MLEIVEIIRQSEQGRNKAFLCRGEDDKLYFVKGKNAGGRRQCCEWVVGNLAQKFGIPVPPLSLVTIPENLILEAKPEFQIMGAGIAFASESQNNSQWFEPSYVNEVQQKLRLDILVFDWWVKNDDRNQDNPNLLWDARSHNLHVIDHDSAFSPDFFPTVFKNYHIFQEDFHFVIDDMVCRAEYASRMVAALSIWDDVCDNAPPDWIDSLSTNREKFNPSAARAILDRCLTTEIWRME